MKKKRLIGVITIRDGIAVQSFGYKKYLPLGKPEMLAKNLDAWGADEILLNDIDRSKYKKKPNFEILEKISKLQLTTPIIYGGGIRNENDAVTAIKLGADRIIIESIFFQNKNIVRKISNKIGSQGLILSLPLIIKKKKIYRYNYLDSKVKNIEKNINNFFENKIISECLITDVENEGSIKNFNTRLIKKQIFNLPLILFGGVGEIKKIKECLKYKNVKAIAIGNCLNYKENYLDSLKESKLKFFFR